MMTPEQREELKQAAMKATRGPWRKEGTLLSPVPADMYPYLVGFDDEDGYAPHLLCAAECDAVHIAMANPAAILSLIAQVEALTVPQWQPIETAPRDGTLILLGRAEDEENDRGAISTPGRWYEGDHDGPDNMGHDAGFMDDEFQQFAWGRSFGNSAYKNGGFQPTHWQPLPSAPTIPAIPGTKEGA